MKFNLTHFLFGFCAGLITIILLLILDGTAFGGDYFQEQREQEYRDSSISRHNDRIEEYSAKPQWQIDNENAVKDINRYNLYKDGDKYDNEIITIEKPYYQRGDLD
jgi:hypothetical protein